MTDDLKSVCTRCQIGIMQNKLMPFTMIENGHMVNVQRMPARVCDVCGYRLFDRDPLVNLRAMLGASRRRTKPAAKKSSSSPRTSSPRKPKG